MYYVTQGYSMKKFETEKEAFDYIKTDVEHHNLSYTEVYNSTIDDIQVIIYQYHTLYLETYVIHKSIDLTDRRY